MSSVPLPARSRTGVVRRPVRSGAVAASTRFAAPDPSGPGADRLKDNLRRLGAEPEPVDPTDSRRPR